MNKFDLKYQYQLYLKRAGLSERNMHPQQRRETKRAFMGAWGQLIVMLSEDILPLGPDEGQRVMDDMSHQVGEYWANENLNQN